MDPRKNFSYGRVSVAPSPTTSGTTISVTNADAAVFMNPATDGGAYNATIWPANQIPLSSNAEIVRVTAKGAANTGGSGHTQLTITRATESSSARSIQVGDQIAQTITKKTFDDVQTLVQAAIDAASSASVVDATTSVKGKLMLAGDLGGTAAAPTVKSRANTITIGPSGTAADYVCTGTHDGVTIKAAVAALPAGGGRILFRNGTYNFDDSTDTIVSAKSNVTFEGETFGGVIFKATGVLHPNGATGGTDALGRYGILTIGKTQTTMVHHVTIRNIVFDVNNMARTAALTLDGGTSLTGVIGLQNVFVENIKTMNSRPADLTHTMPSINLIGGKTQSFGTTKGYLDNISFHNVEQRDNAGIATYVLGGYFTNLSWRDCWFHDNDMGAVYTFDSQDDGMITMSDWKFESCRFERNGLNSTITTGDIFFGWQQGVNNFYVDKCYFGPVGQDTHPHFGVLLYWAANNSIKDSIFYQGWQGINLATSYSGHYNTVFPTNKLQVVGNIFYQLHEVWDPDSTIFAMIKDNYFIEIKTGRVLGAYARHFPTIYEGNIIYNCHTETDGTEAGYSLSAIETGQDGYTVRNNLIIDDRLIPDPNSTPQGSTALTTTTVAGGTLNARTYYIRYTWYNDTGETLGSTEQSKAVGANFLLQTQAPGGVPPSGAKGMNIYVSTTSGSGWTLQGNITNLLSMTGPSKWYWTEPTTGLVTGTAALPSTNTTHAKTLYGIYELSAGLAGTYGSVYQNNHFIGIPTEMFLNSGVRRIRTGNTSEKNGSIRSLPNEGDAPGPVHTAVRVATTVALPANTYDNGSSGVGATITITNVNTNINAAGVDGVTNLAVGDRILVKDEATQANNGVYTLTATGGAGINGVLTRAVDFNDPSEVPESVTFVDEGTVNKAQAFMVANIGTVTFGTTAIPFTRVGTSQVTPPVLASVQYATIAALPANTYSNGTSGVGATITVTNVNTTLSIDGITKTTTPVALAVGDRVLVKNEPDASHNGIYTVTTTGGGGVSAVLTRATDFDQASEIAGVTVFVQSGNRNGGNAWTVKEKGSYTIGTTAIKFNAAVKKTVASVDDYGYVADVTALTGLSITSGSAALTIASGVFTPGDVGKVIVVNGAGASAANLITTISAYTSSTAVTLAANAGTTVSSVAGEYGTDNTAAVQAAADYLDTSGGILQLTSRALPGYVGAVVFSSGTTIQGSGVTTSGVKLKPGTNDYMFTTRDTIANTTSYPHDHTVRDLYIDCNKTYNPTLAGFFKTVKNRNPVIQNCKWQNYNNKAVWMVGSTGNVIQPRVINCQADFGDRTNGTALFLDFGVYDGLLDELDFGRGYNGVVLSQGGNGNFTLHKVLTWGNANLGFQNYQSHNNLITDSTFDQNQGHGVEVNGSNNVNFVNCKFSNNSFADPSNIFGFGANIATPNTASGIRICSTSKNIRLDDSIFTNDIRTASAHNEGGQAYGIQVEDASQIFNTNATYTNMISGHVNTISGTVNHYAVPMGQPGLPGATPSTTGGTLAAGLKTYRVTAIDFLGNETVPSGEVAVTTTGSTSSVALTWTAPTGAVSYRIYRGTNYGAESVYYTSSTNSYTDTNAGGTVSATPPLSSTAFISHITGSGNSYLGGKLTVPSLQIKTATTPVAGQVWQATDTAGNGAWANVAVATRTVGTSGADYITDGTADDVEIQAAIDAVQAIGRGSVYLKSGTYTISAALNLYNGLVKLYGAGRDKTIVQLANSANTHMIVSTGGANPTGIIQGYWLEVSDMTLDGNAANQTSQVDAIHVGAMNEMYLRNLRINAPKRHGIYLGQTGGGMFSTVPLITDVIIRGSVTAPPSGNGIFLDSGSSDCHINSVDIGSFINGAGIMLSGHPGGAIIQAYAWQCKYGFQLYDADRTQIIGALADYSEYSGLVAQLSDDLTITNFKARESSEIYFGATTTTSNYANLAAFPATGTARVVYHANDSGLNYFWNGSYLGLSRFNGIWIDSGTRILMTDVWSQSTLAGYGLQVETATNVEVWAYDFSNNVTGQTTGAGIASVYLGRAQVDSKAPLASPALTGTPTAPTASAGTNSTQIATTAYADAAVSAMAAGLDWKVSVRVATTANGTLATAYANGQTVDGVTLATGNRILLKNQTTGSENGIYTVNASGAPTRATDADASSEVTPNMTVFVEEGTTNADTGWTLTNNSTITLGTTALTFTQFTGASAVDASSSTKGVVQLTNDLGGSATAPTVTVTHLASALPIAQGGTAGTTAAAARTALGVAIGTDVQAWDADLDTWATKTAPSGTAVGTTDTQTLTNKRVTKRVTTITSSATPTVNSDSTDMVAITALAANITSMTSGLTGTPTEGQPLVYRILDNGTARTIAWGASFASRGATLPTTTVLGKYLYVGLMYNSVTSTFDCIATSQEA